MHFRFLRRLLLAGLLLGAAAWLARGDEGFLPATPDKLPRWRGFNLQNKFNVGNDRPFREDDFRMIHELGFNFVRLPMDYRIWIRNGDWTRIDEKKAFGDLDQAVAWGAKYHIHICLNFHRAPGYTVAKPPEPRSLWTDPEAQRVCALHWAAFARHYRGVPNERLSFDLFNEPPAIDPAVYARVVALMVAAIRAEDSARLIIADGLKFGSQPCPLLASLHIAQATRGYEPHLLTHYRADWMAGSDQWPVPTWPMVQAYAYLYGPQKRALGGPLSIAGAFPAGTRLDLIVGSVSSLSRLVVRVDDQVVLDRKYVSGPIATQGEKVVYLPQFHSYQNVFDQPQSIVLPRAATKITLSNEEGDWMTLGSLGLTVNGARYTLTLERDWGRANPPLVFDPTQPSQPWHSPQAMNRQWLWEHDIEPWRQLQTLGVGVMVGEWGCFNRTPDDVAMRWMEDNLANFQRAGWGWALWNFSGGFGLLDSDRPGATYENFEGHQLDRRMLELLQRY